MSEAWSKIAPGQVGMPAPPVEEPSGIRGAMLRCSAQGCSFESDAFHAEVKGEGARPFCEHHASGKDVAGKELVWATPCACGRVAAGYERDGGGVTARHTERQCIVRTVSLVPEEITIPSGFPLRDPVEPTWIGTRARCACGRMADGLESASSGCTESHSFRQCIEMTVKLVPGEVTLPNR